MHQRLSIILLVLVAALALTAALVSADAHLAMVSVGHGIPGPDVDPAADPALPVDVIVNEECFLHDLEFGDFEGPFELDSAGTYSVSVALSDGDPDLCDGDVVIGPVELTFEAGTNSTVFAHLTADGVPTATVFLNDVSDTVAGHTRMTVRHTAAEGPIDLYLNRGWIHGRFIDEALGLENPDQTDPADRRPGAYAVSIFMPGEEEPFFQIPETEDDRPLVTHPHRSHLIYVVGSQANETFTILVQDIDLGHTPPPRPVAPE